MRSFMRKAKIVFWIAWIAVGLLAATVLASHLHPPILALIAGAFAGLIIAALASSIVAAWPVIRIIWWWLPELSLAGGLIVGWTELASHTGLVARLIAVTVLVAVPAAVAPIRRCLYALAWCQVSRHRIRTCFNEFIISNRTGTLPLILGARPTPAGERLWVFLRPGLSLDDIQDRADKIAVGCWASTVIADQAKSSNSALVRIDIKRRDPLNQAVTSPLMAVFGGIIPSRKPSSAPAPVALDLTDVQAADVILTRNGTTSGNGSPARPKWPNQPARRDPEPASTESDELSDWV
jgi:hypothetical protein